MTHKLHSIESVLKASDGLEPREVGELLESAVKFFLFQRTQIPVPFSSLHASTDDDVEGNGKPNLMQRSHLREESLTTVVVPDLEDNCTGNAIQRQRRLKEIRLDNLRQRAIAFKLQKTRLIEYKIRAILDEALQTLRKVIENSFIESGGTAALVLLFGPSIRTAKEIVIFEVDRNAVKCSNIIGLINNSSEKNSIPERTKALDSVIRRFYQSIICTSAFGEFTSKQLRSTYTHLALMTSAQLPDQVLTEHNIKLLEDFYLPENLCVASEEPGNRSRGISRKRNLLHVKIQQTPCSVKERDFAEISNETNNRGNGQAAYKNLVSSSDSFHSYQIPLVFKGVQVRMNHKS